MWGQVFESFAEAIGVTRRVRPFVFAAVVGVSLVLTAVSLAEGGPRGLFAVALLLALGLGASAQVLRARAALWRAARGRLDDPKQAPPAGRDDPDLAPTTLTLQRLARAVNEARRGAFVDASRTLDTVDRGRLRPEEERLVDAARALVSLGVGDTARAAHQASLALPTTSEDIDAMLGRALVADAWGDAERLRGIDEGWAAQGVTSGTRRPLPRLRAIVRLRIDVDAMEALESWEAKELADEARAVGDEALAADLEAKIHPAAYR